MRTTITAAHVLLALVLAGHAAPVRVPATASTEASPVGIPLNGPCGLSSPTLVPQTLRGGTDTFLTLVVPDKILAGFRVDDLDGAEDEPLFLLARDDKVGFPGYCTIA
ncbi:hypothetical protein C8R46DRAFT_1036031 [Mycena filopes]|nr:hypothetical protein C8R46DRAFT_1036031 [Mycena filopes]